MKEDLVKEIERALAGLLEEAGDSDPLPEVSLEVPRQPEHGDFACSVAMSLAKRLRKAPREIAEGLLARIGDAGGLLAETEVAGPGFINMRIGPGAWQALTREIVAAGADYGRSDTGNGEKLQVEFVSANPTGPLSTGHGRQAILGDCLARLLAKVGYAVTREYYFNDGGRQMRVLGESVKARYLEELGKAAAPPPEALANPEEGWVTEVDGLEVAFPADGYQGEYIRDIARLLLESHAEALVESIIPGIRDQLAQPGGGDKLAALQNILESLQTHMQTVQARPAETTLTATTTTTMATRQNGIVYWMLAPHA